MRSGLNTHFSRAGGKIYGKGGELGGGYTSVRYL